MSRLPASALCLLVTLGLCLTHTALGFADTKMRDGREIMEEVATRHTSDTEAALMQMVLIDESGNAQQRRFLSAGRNKGSDAPHVLMRFLKPESIEGVTLLTCPEGGGLQQYLFLPAVGESREITGEGRAGYFMGSDFTFEDLREEDMTEHEYHRRLDGEIDGQKVYVVMSVPVGVNILRATGYAHRTLYIEKESFNICRIEFFAPGRSDPIKTLEAERFRPISQDGTSRPHRLTMRNHERGTTTVMTIQSSIIGLDLKEAWFEPDALNQWDKIQTDLLAKLEAN
ncbi:MAG: outer membrane lipoprotein-sorting protein [Opitutales bacterium]